MRMGNLPKAAGREREEYAEIKNHGSVTMALSS